MRERGYVNGDRPDNFNMNLTTDQKEQYGLQFDGEEATQEQPQPQPLQQQPTPGIVGKLLITFDKKLRYITNDLFFHTVDEVPDMPRSEVCSTSTLLPIYNASITIHARISIF